MFSLFCEYINLEYARVLVIYGVNQAEYVIHIRVAASQDYANTYSTRRILSPPKSWAQMTTCVVGPSLVSPPQLYLSLVNVKTTHPDSLDVRLFPVVLAVAL